MDSTVRKHSHSLCTAGLASQDMLVSVGRFRSRGWGFHACLETPIDVPLVSPGVWPLEVHPSYTEDSTEKFSLHRHEKQAPVLLK